MFFSLVSRELLQHTLSYRYRTLLLMVVLVGIGATVVRTHVYLDLLGDHRRVVARRAHTRSDIPYYYFGLIMGYTRQKQPNSLAVFCNGLENEMTRSLRARRGMEDAIGPRALSGLFFRINPPFDITTVVAVVFSLAALLLTHDSLSGERERGTLKVLLAGPLAKGTVVGAKWTAGVVALGLPLAIAWVLGMLYLLLIARPAFGTAQWLALVSMVVGSLVYCTVFLSAGLACSAFCIKSSTSLATCLFIWAASTIIAPNLVAPLARSIADVPSHASMHKLMEETYAESEANHPKRFPHSAHPGSDTSHYRAVKAAQVAMESQQGVREAYQRFRNKLREQQTVASSLVGLSPATAYTYLMSELAGTGTGSYNLMHDLWQQAATEYKAKQFAWADSRNADDLPGFRPASLTIEDSLRTAFVPALSLCAFAVLLFVSALLAFVLRARVHIQE
ncbi:MAG: ABC transporter permease subunit [Chitinivibrionales bacterium]|nr:ABC transporter permease subunit [Chitinivibrionales bacterium]